MTDIIAILWEVFRDSLVLLAVAYGLTINLATALMFWFDKRQARHGGRRVPENRLLTLGAMGGSPAAQFARNKLRHKTQKQPFANRMQHIVQMQRVGLVALAIVMALLLW